MKSSESGELFEEESEERIETDGKDYKKLYLAVKELVNLFAEDTAQQRMCSHRRGKEAVLHVLQEYMASMEAEYE